MVGVEQSGYGGVRGSVVVRRASQHNGWKLRSFGIWDLLLFLSGHGGVHRRHRFGRTPLLSLGPFLIRSTTLHDIELHPPDSLHGSILGC